jgi:APA family basic amino acid/polyamine antiporter
MEDLKHKIGWKTATAIVISNMIGTGVFTTLGFQVVELQNTITIFCYGLLVVF